MDRRPSKARKHNVADARSKRIVGSNRGSRAPRHSEDWQHNGRSVASSTPSMSPLTAKADGHATVDHRRHDKYSGRASKCVADAGVATDDLRLLRDTAK